ncbi:MAG TPA: hypothetical protein VKJ07_02055, partial [Mycobacteriales bacterium]|nr:hypothetical protein [Mycobacteriales bacterium]
RLVRAGIARREQLPRAATGEFAVSSYVLRVELLAGVIEPSVDAASTRPGAYVDTARQRVPRKTRPRQHARSDDQLTLIDLTDPAS